jgi:uncharacterized protein DUF6378
MNNPAKAATILINAAELVNGPRNHTHGDCVKQHEGAALMITAYLRAKHKFIPDLTAEDICWMIALLKASRAIFGAYNADDYKDGAAYIAIAGVCKESELKS